MSNDLTPGPTVFDVFMHAALRSTPTPTDVDHAEMRAVIAANGLDPSMPVSRLREDLEIASRARAAQLHFTSDVPFAKAYKQAVAFILGGAGAALSTPPAATREMWTLSRADGDPIGDHAHYVVDGPHDTAAIEYDEDGESFVYERWVRAEIVHHTAPNQYVDDDEPAASPVQETTTP